MGKRVGAALRERLEARREEIEAAALTRVAAISDPAAVSDPAYAEGLRAAVAAAIDYGIQTTGREASDPPIPVALLAQARLAARAGIPLDTVLRRYFAGYSLLGYFVLEEASNAGITDGAELKRLLGTHAGVFDRLLGAIGEEYGREGETPAASSRERRRAERIEQLLAGELVETSEVPYDFDGWHLGLLAAGAVAEQRVGTVAAGLGCRLLCVPREGGATWAWLGARRCPDPAEVMDALAPLVQPRDAALALGEPAEGLAGWRLTHRQAAAALPLAEPDRRTVVRYRDIAVLACALKDDLLATSMHEIYFAPLQGQTGDLTLLETAHAYLAADHKVSSAAARLGVSRQTVNNRLRSVERVLGQSLRSCAVELELALRLKRHRRAREPRQTVKLTAPDLPKRQSR